MTGIIEVARNLVSESGENPEYDRAITELVGELLGVSLSDYREVVALLIGVHPTAIATWNRKQS